MIVENRNNNLHLNIFVSQTRLSKVVHPWGTPTLLSQNSRRAWVRFECSISSTRWSVVDQVDHKEKMTTMTAMMVRTGAPMILCISMTTQNCETPREQWNITYCVIAQKRNLTVRLQTDLNVFYIRSVPLYTCCRSFTTLTNVCGL